MRHTPYLLYNGYAFSGPATATLLLNELNNFRFLADETASELCLRLQEVFEDLAAVPGESSIEFSDTQKINYLLSAIRHERTLSSVYALIQTDQLRGRVTFDQACDDLRYRCESLRADELLNTSVRPTRVRGLATTADPVVPALITSAAKRQNGSPPTVPSTDFTDLDLAHSDSVPAAPSTPKDAPQPVTAMHDQPLRIDSDDSIPTSSPTNYSVHNRDRDLSREMGHHLRWPLDGPSIKHTAPNLTPLPVPIAPLGPTSMLPDPPTAFPAERVRQSPSPPPPTRVLRPRTNSQATAGSVPLPTKRRPVGQRWYYDSTTPAIPGTPVLAVSPLPGTPTDFPPPPKRVRFSGSASAMDDWKIHDGLPLAAVVPLPAPLPPSVALTTQTLRPRQLWMMDGDSRTDAEADADWRSFNDQLFSGPLPDIP